MSKQRYFYYYDEVNDDFANNGIKTKPTPENYDYQPANALHWLLHVFVYYLVLFLYSVIHIFGAGYSVRNSEVIKKRKNRRCGYFVYGNHTNGLSDALSMPSASFPKITYTIVHPDAISMPVFGRIVALLGTLPRPSSRNNFTRFNKAIEKIIERGCPVMVFPEAHIWPKYNKIRNFPDVSFYYPVKLNVPCYAKTTVYKKKANGHTSALIYFDGPFYPNQELPFKQAQKDLRDRVFEQMTKRTQNAELDCDYHYIKVDAPEKVRTEIVKKMNCC